MLSAVHMRASADGQREIEIILVAMVQERAATLGQAMRLSDVSLETRRDMATCLRHAVNALIEVSK